MKGGYPDALRSEAHDCIHPLPHLPRGFISKGDREDIPGIHFLFFDQICDPLRQHACFPASCPGKDQYGAFRLKHRLPLSVVQHVQIFHFLFSIACPCRRFLSSAADRSSDTNPFFRVPLFPPSGRFRFNAWLPADSCFPYSFPTHQAQAYKCFPHGLTDSSVLYASQSAHA